MSTPNPIAETELHHPRRTPLLKPTREVNLSAPLWFAVGIAAILHAFISPLREALKLLHPDQVRDCMDCDRQHVREGNTANLDVADLDPEAVMLFVSALKASIVPSGLTAEFHCDGPAQGQHVAIYSDRPTTTQLDMHLASSREAASRKPPGGHDAEIETALTEAGIARQ